MFESLTIKNFQSHEESSLDFCAGVNVITGDPNNGKTSILRCLTLLSQNRPSGFRYHSNFTDKPTEIILKVDGHTVSFKKDEKNATYQLDDEKWRKFGTSVPDKIINLLNLSDLNFQKQLDIPFLVTSSAGEVARTINKITKLEEVDSWVSDLTSQLNSKNKEIKIVKVDIKQVEDDLETFKDLEKVDTLLSRIAIYGNSIDKITTEKENIEEILTVLEEVDRELSLLLEVDEIAECLQKVFGINKEIEDVLLEATEIMELADELDSLVDIDESIFADYEDLQEVSIELDEVMEEWESIGSFVEADTAFDDVDVSVFDNFEALTTASEVYNDVVVQLHTIEAFTQADDAYGTCTRDYNKVKDEYVNMLKEYGKCPTCFGELTNECLHRIQEEL